MEQEMTQRKAELVYIVDSDVAVRSFVHKEMVALGYEAHAFDLASDVVIASQENPPDLLITALLMPEINGVELVEALEPIVPSLPVICLSEFGDTIRRESSGMPSEVGVKGFLAKPLKSDELRRSVTQVLESRSGKRASYSDRSKVHVLLVDDNEQFIDAEKTALEMAGYAVDVCYRGVEALERLILHQYDIVILDMILPGLSGSEVLKRIKEHDRLQPVIMVTGEASPEVIAECENITGECCLRKPLDLNDLIGIIEGYDRRLLAADRHLRRQRILHKISRKMDPELRSQYHTLWSRYYGATESSDSSLKLALLYAANIGLFLLLLFMFFKQQSLTS